MEAGKRRRKRRPDATAMPWPASGAAAQALEVGEVLPAGSIATPAMPGVVMDPVAGRARQASEGPQMDWMIQKFKTMPCRVQLSASSHDHRCCPYFHSDRDRRRPVFHTEDQVVANYKAEPCANRFDDSRSCSMGDMCGSCHSTAELLYHPNLFKKRLCHQLRRCPRGKYCAFAHTRQELLVPNFSEQEENEPTEEFIAYRFKTQWCPIGGPHDWESCVYAHTYRDWRRTPLLGYSSHPCPRWSGSIAKGSPELDYGMRCPHGVSCPLAHGAKEQLYHPHFYKTSPCSDPSCRRGPLCAFTHGEEDSHKAPTDTAAKVTRKPIPKAHQILTEHQPTYATPPMYHALEDAPKSGASKSRRQRGRNGRDRAVTLPEGCFDAVLHTELPLQPPPSPPEASFPSSFPSMASTMPAPMPLGQEVLYTAPYPPYMWLPVSSQVGMQPDPNPMFWGGCSPLSPASASPQMPCLFMPPAMPAAEVEFPAVSHATVAAIPEATVNLSSWRLPDKVKDLDILSNGWRTLSSFGSLPGSVGQSAASTPRSPRSVDVDRAESTKSSLGGSGSGSLDSSKLTASTTSGGQSPHPVLVPVAELMPKQLALEAR